MSSTHRWSNANIRERSEFSENKSRICKTRSNRRLIISIFAIFFGSLNNDFYSTFTVHNNRVSRIVNKIGFTINICSEEGTDVAFNRHCLKVSSLFFLIILFLTLQRGCSKQAATHSATVSKLLNVCRDESWISFPRSISNCFSSEHLTFLSKQNFSATAEYSFSSTLVKSPASLAVSSCSWHSSFSALYDTNVQSAGSPWASWNHYSIIVLNKQYLTIFWTQ